MDRAVLRPLSRVSAPANGTCGDEGQAGRMRVRVEGFLFRVVTYQSCRANTKVGLGARSLVLAYREPERELSGGPIRLWRLGFDNQALASHFVSKFVWAQLVDICVPTISA
jgi:hypothetical protein